MPVFTFPWAFFGLLALPALAGVYFFRKRSRPICPVPPSGIVPP